MTVLAEVGVAMMEGARKYGKHNYRIKGVRASVYFDALFRHMAKWWEGEDIDADSGLSHVTKAIATLFVLRDAMIQGMLNDDRPPKAPEGFFKDLEAQCKAVIAKYPGCVPAFTEEGLNKPIDFVPVPDSEIILDEKPIRCVCGFKLVDGVCTIPFPIHRAAVVEKLEAEKLKKLCPDCGTTYIHGDRHACFKLAVPASDIPNYCPHCGRNADDCSCI
jgi:hypothetical protein